MAAAQWIYPDSSDYTLEYLSLRLTTMPQWRPLGKLSQEDFDALPDDALRQRCGGDAEAAYRLYPILSQEITRLGLTKIWNLAMQVLPILAEIGGRGMAVNRDWLANRVRRYGQWLQQAKPALETELGIENVGSHEQRANALYGPQFKATALRKTTKGYSTDRTSLLWARYQARQAKDEKLEKILTRLIKYGTVSKLHSTYYKPWLSIGEGLRVYSNYSVGRTSTGRLSSYDENLQNLPPDVRDLIIPSDGYDYIVQADFKQLEWRIAAHISRDETMLHGIHHNHDAHSQTAARALGLLEPTTKEEFRRFKEQYPQERSIGKMTNFSVLFGVSAESLAWQIFTQSDGRVWIQPSDVQRYIDAFSQRFVGWGNYCKWLRSQEVLVSQTGRTWWFDKSEADQRQRQNYPIQSLASDTVLMVLRDLSTILWRDGWRSRIVAEVHDSIVLEVPKNELKPIVQLLNTICRTPQTKPFGFQLTVPLDIDIQYGPTWGQLGPIEFRS